MNDKYETLQHRFLMRQQRPVYLISGVIEDFLILVLANKTQNSLIHDYKLASDKPCISQC